MFSRLTGWAGWVSMAGTAALLLGLGADAVVHRIDPTLAEREGVFTLTNPAHALFAAGIGLIIAGAVLFLLGRLSLRPATSLRRKTLLLAPIAGIIALSGVSLSFAMASPGGLTGHTHAHTDGTHVDTVTHGFTTVGAVAVQPEPATTGTSASGLPGVVHAHGTEVPITPEQLSAAMKLWNDTKDGTQRLEDFAVAQAEGYRQITPWTYNLAHFHNVAYNASDRVLDPTRPDELIYARLPNKTLKLVGVMFLAKQGQAGPKVGGALTTWHAHDNLCFSLTNGMVAALKDPNGRCPSGTTFAGVTPEMLHVWLVDNPSGIFSEDMNPTALSAVLKGS